MKFEEWWESNHIPHAKNTDPELVEIIKSFSRVAWESHQPQWMPIITAPNDESILLAMPTKSGVEQIVASITEYGIICPEDNVLAYSVMDFSHWMPLPQPPKEMEE